MSKNIHKFKKPITVDGVTYDEAELKFDELTANDMIAIEQELQGDGIVIANMAELSKTYLIYATARACGINVNVLKQFPMAEISKLTAKTQAFLLEA